MVMLSNLGFSWLATTHGPTVLGLGAANGLDNLALALHGTALIAFLSPELSEIMVRLGYSEPCELRRMPVGRTMSALHASAQWRRYAGQVSAGSPSDV